MGCDYSKSVGQELLPERGYVRLRISRGSVLGLTVLTKSRTFEPAAAGATHSRAPDRQP
jgi:hypothetical protein